MGKINVIIDGKAVTVDEADYKLAQGEPGAPREQTPAEGIDQVAEARRKEKASGLKGAATAFVTSALDTATFGAAGKVLDAYNPEEGQFNRDARQQHGVANFAGGLTGFALPGAAGVAAAAGDAVKGVTGLASAGKVVEGGLLGAGGHIANTNVTGDPLSIEGIAEGFGVGGVINLGIGALASGFRGAAKGRPNVGPDGELTFAPVKGGGESLLAKAQRLRKVADDAKLAEDAYGFSADEAKAVAADKAASVQAANGVRAASAAKKEAVDGIKAATKSLNELPTYGSLKDAHSAATDVAIKANKAIEAEQAAYDAFASPKGVSSAIKDYEKIQNRLRAEIKKAPDTGPAYDPGLPPTAEVAPGGTPSEFPQGVKDQAAKASRKLPARARNRGYTPTAPGEALPSIPSSEAPNGDFSANVNVKEAAAGPGAEFPAGIRNAAGPGDFSAEVRSQAPVSQVKTMSDTLKKMSDAKAAAQKFAKAGNFEGAADALEATNEDIQQWLPDERVELPLRPLDKLQELPPAFPKKLSDIGKLRADTIAKLSNSMDDATVTELNKLAEDVGVMPGETPGDTLATLHKHIRDTLYTPARAVGAVKAIEAEAVPDYEEYAVVHGPRNTSPEEWNAAAAEVDAARAGERTGMNGQEPAYQESKWSYGGKTAAKSEVNTGSLLDTPIKLAKTGTVLAVARAASRVFGFGWGGSLARVFAASGASHSLDAIEAAVGGAAIAGKASARSSIGEAFSRFAAVGANALDTLGPVAASLGGSFPYGKEDPAKDVRDLAKNRIHDLSQMAQVAPDILYNMVKNIAGEGGQVGLKLHQQYLNQINYLNQVAPKDPGLDQTMNGSGWKMSYTQADDFAHQWQAVMHPLVYLARTISGNGSAKGVAALAATWPAMLNEARSEAAMRSWSGLTLQGHRGLSMLFQRPMSPLQDPNVFWLIQGQQLPQPQQQVASSGGSHPPTGGPPGRRPAFDSAVAGSSVDALTRQG